ncbi:MAG: sigma-70 family RNA polymerase sigma factor [Planctomycetes bacterium]|nr:sigma-70 family RNA polymerase sigma factor [Planctomycetota bacterium]
MKRSAENAEMDAQRLKATINAAKTGSPQAYRALLDAYGHRLYAYFLRTVRNHHLAEDMLGDLTLKLVQQLPRYDERGRFDQWLFRIAANMVRDWFRRQKVRPYVVSLSAAADDHTTLASSMAGKSPPVDAGLLGGEVSARLHEALGRLGQTTREMIVLRHFSEMSFKEIAEIYECPLGTVLARVHRGLKLLRRIMSEEEGKNTNNANNASD